MDSYKNNHIAFANFVDSLPSNVELIQVQNGNIMQRKIEVAKNVKLNSNLCAEYCCEGHLDRYFNDNTQLFTKQEIAVLEKEFEKNMYISKDRKEELAAALNIGMSQIGIWFQNKRRAVKRNLVKMQKTRKENVPPTTETTNMIASNVGNWIHNKMSAGINSNAISTVKPADYFPETSGYTSHDMQYGWAQNPINTDINSSVNPIVQPEIDLALPETWGYTSDDVQCGATQNGINASASSNKSPTVQPEIHVALPEAWSYTSDDLYCDWTQRHIEPGINWDGHTSTVDCEYDFFADF